MSRQYPFVRTIPNKWTTRCLINGLSATGDMTSALTNWWSQVVDTTNARTISLGFSLFSATASASGQLTINPNFSDSADSQLYRPTGASGFIEGYGKGQVAIVYNVTSIGFGNFRLWTWSAIGDQFRLRVTSNLGAGDRLRLKNWRFFMVS